MDRNTKYNQMGRAALWPGMQFMLEIMQEQLDQFRAELNELNGAPRRPGRPKGVPNKPKEIAAAPAAVNGKRASGWPADPKARSKEMLRRRAKRKKDLPATAAVRDGKTVKPYLHIGNPAHPGHEEWLRKLKAAGQKRWDNMSKAERDRNQKLMQDARRVVDRAKAVQA